MSDVPAVGRYGPLHMPNMESLVGAPPFEPISMRLKMIPSSGSIS